MLAKQPLPLYSLLIKEKKSSFFFFFFFFYQRRILSLFYHELMKDEMTTSIKVIAKAKASQVVKTKIFHPPT